MRNKKGFTILELLVVVAIIAILSAIAIPNFVGRIDDAKASQELAEINAVEKAMANYYVDNGTYPTLQGKDGTLLQPQPIEGSPHNIDFSSLVPTYLANLPQFSYWWVDYEGKVYHTDKTLGTLSGGVFTLTDGYSYTLYRPNGTSQVLSAPYTLLAGEYIVGKEESGFELPKIGLAFKNAKMHPEDPEYVVPVTFTSQTFDFTGDVQTFIVPVSGTYQLDLYGSQGGYHSGSSAGAGGYGGNAKGNITLTLGQTVYVYVGGMTGWNGGGSGMSGGTGGGGTDIRIQGTALANRVIVAGGGGGGYALGAGPGAGGGLTGTVGSPTNGDTSEGGTQTAAGYGGGLGYGGSAQYPYHGSGGGGGYYGGGANAGRATNKPGGGGSGYIGGVSSGSMQTGVRSGNGQATITYIGP